jgi:hypothetical protein
MIELKDLQSHLDKATKKILTHYKREVDIVIADWHSDVNTQIVGEKLEAHGEDWRTWFYVDKGTKPHMITAKNAPYLVIPYGKYIPKTKPIAKNLGTPYYGKPTEYRKPYSVKHPGSKPRKFTETFVEEYHETALRELSDAVMEAIKSI